MHDCVKLYGLEDTRLKKRDLLHLMVKIYFLKLKWDFWVKYEGFSNPSMGVILEVYTATICQDNFLRIYILFQSSRIVTQFDLRSPRKHSINSLCGFF
jgi:hypothetical protein